MSGSDERSRALGGLVCLAAVAAGALFLYGIAVQNYWALALPVAAALIFVLVLIFWVGWTIATVQAQAEGDSLPPAGGPGSATVADPEDATAGSPPPAEPG